jgi:hypothetical protein
VARKVLKVPVEFRVLEEMELRVLVVFLESQV